LNCSGIDLWSLESVARASSNFAITIYRSPREEREKLYVRTEMNPCTRFAFAGLAAGCICELNTVAEELDYLILRRVSQLRKSLVARYRLGRRVLRIRRD